MLRIQIQVNPPIMVPLRARLFRFTTEEGIDTKDFAEKTGMSVMSVNSMIRHAKGNAKLYEEMVELGYSDESFPVWWYSPGRAGQEGDAVEQQGITGHEGEQIAEKGIEGREEEDFEPTPPDTPAPREGRLARPALPLPAKVCPPLLRSPMLSFPCCRIGGSRRSLQGGGCILRSRQMAGSC